MVGTAGADTDMPQAADAERSPAPRPLTSHHMADIIVVADTTWVINDVRAALGEDRFTIHEITDPRAVVEAVREGTPTAVIVDFQVGSMGGMALTRAVRDAFSAGTEAAPPVILLLDRDADAFLAGRSGAAPWVRKPFSSADLRSAIDRLVPPPGGRGGRPPPPPRERRGPGGGG